MLKKSQAVPDRDDPRAGTPQLRGSDIGQSGRLWYDRGHNSKTVELSLQVPPAHMIKKFFIGVAAIGALPVLLVATFPGSQPHPMQSLEQGTQQADNTGEATASKDVATDQPPATAGAPSTGTDQHAPDATASPSPSTYYAVTGVVDGDTIKIGMNGREETLRLIGIDTPETVERSPHPDVDDRHHPHRRHGGI
jgi:hypothetical protein